jgi:tetratricopeptide (TPR) repeat protein
MLRAVYCALKKTGKAQLGSRSVLGLAHSTKKSANNVNVLFSQKPIVDTSYAFYAVKRRKLRTKVTKEKDLQRETVKPATPAPQKNEAKVKDASYYYSKGKDLESKDKFPEALKAYEKADSLEPDNPLIQFGLGSVHLHMNQVEKAIEKLKLSIRLAEMVKRPDDALLQTVARAYNNLAIIRFEQGKLELAKKNFKKAIIVDHTLPDIYVNLGLICIRQKKYSEALQHLKQGLQTFKNLSERGEVEDGPEEEKARIAYLYQQMAIAYGSMGKHNKAHTALKKSHMLNPDDLTVTRMLAKLSEEREEFYDAVQYYEQILEQVEADHEAHAQLGTLYSREDLPLYNLYKAVEHLETAYELDPSRYDIAMALGILHFNNTGDTEKAAAYLMQVLKDKNPDPQRLYIAHLTLANIALVTKTEHNTLLVQADKASFAVKHFVKAAEISPNPALYENIAQCYLKAGELDQAIKALEKSIELNDQRAQPLSWLALLYLKQDQFGRAQSLATKALSLRQYNRLANYVMGKIAYLAKDLNTAVSHMTAALSETESDQEPTYIDVFQTDPSLVRDALRVLSESLQAKGDYEEALNVTTQALANNGEDFDLAFRAGTLYYDKGEFPKAALMFRRASVVEPNSIEAPLRLADTLMRMEDYGQALVYINKAISNGEKHHAEQVPTLLAIRQAISVLTGNNK